MSSAWLASCAEVAVVSQRTAIPGAVIAYCRSQRYARQSGHRLIRCHHRHLRRAPFEWLAQVGVGTSEL